MTFGAEGVLSSFVPLTLMHYLSPVAFDILSTLVPTVWAPGCVRWMPLGPGPGVRKGREVREETWLVFHISLFCTLKPLNIY